MYIKNKNKNKNSNGLSQFFFSRILRVFFLSHVLRFLLHSLVKVSFFLKKKLKVSLKDHNRFDIVKGKYQNDKTLF